MHSQHFKIHMLSRSI